MWNNNNLRGLKRILERSGWLERLGWLGCFQLLGCHSDLLNATNFTPLWFQVNKKVMPKLWKIAVTSKYVLKYPISIKYPTNTLLKHNKKKLKKILFPSFPWSFTQKKKAKIKQNIWLKTKHRIFRTKMYARAEKFTPLHPVMQVTCRRSGVIVSLLLWKALTVRQSYWGKYVEVGDGWLVVGCEWWVVGAEGTSL